MRRPYTFDQAAPEAPGAPAGRAWLDPRRLRGLAIPLVMLVALVVIAAACSNAPKSPGVAGQASPNSTNAGAAASGPQSSGALAEMMAYSRCMRTHGILDFPDPTPNPGGPGGSFSWSGNGNDDDLNPNNPRYQAANKTCQPLLPDKGQLSAPSAKRLAEEVQMAACMRSHGVPNFPDPDAQGAFDLGNVNRSVPQFRGALARCQSLTGFKGPMPVDISHEGP